MYIPISYSYTTGRNYYLNALAYGNGDSVQYTYDDHGRVTKQTYEDGSTVSYKYDNTGALATVTDSSTGISTTYYYDFTDRLMRYVESGNNYSHIVGYEYDNINNLTALVETINGVDHTTAYTYDDDNSVAYCGNNPVNRIDPNGHAWKDIKNWFSNTWNTVKETALKVVETGRNFIGKINNYVNSFTQELSYKSSGPKKGAIIVDSYTLNDPVLMHKYINENRGDNITGSTNGVVFEWVIHNVAYRTGQFIKVVGLEDIGEEFMSRGRTLDIGSTIYDDNHGFLSGMMWAFYACVDPINAGRDALIEIFE